MNLQRLEGFYWVARAGGYARAARAFPAGAFPIGVVTSRPGIFVRGADGAWKGPADLPAGNPATEAALKSWLERVRRFKSLPERIGPASSAFSP